MKLPYKINLVIYGKYNMQEWMEILNRCQFGIWLGRHESQGFAVEESLARNVPLLVWNVRMRYQEVGYEKQYANIKTPVTTIPYWDERCGEFFYEANEFLNSMETFLSKLYTYKPRDFVIDKLSKETISENLKNIVNNNI